MGVGNCVWDDLGLPRLHRIMEIGQTSLLPKKGRQAARTLSPYRQDTPNGADCRSNSLTRNNPRESCYVEEKKVEESIDESRRDIRVDGE